MGNKESTVTPTQHLREDGIKDNLGNERFFDIKAREDIQHAFKVYTDVDINAFRQLTSPNDDKKIGTREKWLFDSKFAFKTDSKELQYKTFAYTGKYHNNMWLFIRNDGNAWIHYLITEEWNIVHQYLSYPLDIARVYIRREYIGDNMNLYRYCNEFITHIYLCEGIYCEWEPSEKFYTETNGKSMKPLQSSELSQLTSNMLRFGGDLDIGFCTNKKISGPHITFNATEHSYKIKYLWGGIPTTKSDYLAECEEYSDEILRSTRLLPDISELICEYTFFILDKEWEDRLKELQQFV